MCVCVYLSVVDGRGFHSGEEILDDAVEQRQVDGGQLGHVHVLHGHQQDLGAEQTAKGCDIISCLTFVHKQTFS